MYVFTPVWILSILSVKWRVHFANLDRLLETDATRRSRLKEGFALEKQARLMHVYEYNNNGACW